jgi:hypothetical protein
MTLGSISRYLRSRGVLAALVVLALSGLAAIAWAQNVSNYNEQGGARTVIGGSLDVVSGGDLDIESGGAIKIAGTAVTASAADLNATSAVVGSITVVAANNTTNTIDVTVTVLDPDGTAITSPVPVYVWLSDLSTGLGGSAHTHSTGPAFTSGEEWTEHITNDAWTVLTTAGGVAVLQLVDTANEDVTINAALGTIRGSDTTVSGDWT